MGGLLAFVCSSFIYYFIGHYNSNADTELLWSWSFIIFGVILGGILSIATTGKLIWRYLLIGFCAFWFAIFVTPIAVDGYDWWIHPIDLRYPWLTVLSSALTGGMGSLILSFRLTFFRDKIVLICATILCFVLGTSVTLSLFDYIGLHAEMFPFLNPLWRGLIAFSVHSLCCGLIWRVAWSL